MELQKIQNKEEHIHNSYYENIKNSSNVEINEEKIINNNYIWLFALLGIVFILFAYYFYNLVKKFLERIIKNPEDETKVDQTKNEIFKNLSLYCFIRAVSCFIIFICCNPQSQDFPSFISYNALIFPQLILFSILLIHVAFIIEKYYQIKYRKTDIFFTPSLEILNILIYIIFGLFMLGCTLKRKFLTFMFLCTGLTGFISSILAILYLYYGLSLANIYSSKKNNYTEFKEKKFIYSKLFFMSFILGIIYSLNCIISFLISMGFFGKCYPETINPHIWEFSKLCFCEFFTVLVMANTKQRHEESEYNKKSFLNFNEKEAVLEKDDRIELHQNQNGIDMILDDMNEPLIDN